MDVTPLIRKDQHVIQSYSNGRFRVSGVLHDGAIIVMPDAVHKWDGGVAIAHLCEESFEPLLNMADEIDVVLFGCGARMAFLDPALKQSLSAKGLSVDVMDTGAACRTYNVLMAEGRRVVAALLPA